MNNQTTTHEPNTKAGPACPHCNSATILYCFPHKDAGIWECQNTDCGATDSCDHDDTTHEIIEVDYLRQGEHDTRNSEIEVCTDCGVQVGR